MDWAPYGLPILVLPIIELMDFIGTDSQLTGIVAVGFADEAPAKRPRKPLEEIVEYR